MTSPAHSAALLHASDRRLVWSLWVASGCVLLTGSAALVYEICWIRLASLVFGSTTWAVSSVLAIFFAGLATGSLLAGRASSGIRHPLQLCGWLELGVGLTGLASLPLFAFSDRVYSAVYPHVLDSAGLLTFLRVASAAVVLLPPTILMGASLPLFCQFYVRRTERVSRGVGWLYAINTLGAAAGAAMCGFYLIPQVGVQRSIFFAASVNLIVSLMLWRLSRIPSEVSVDSGVSAPQSLELSSKIHLSNECPTTENSGSSTPSISTPSSSVRRGELVVAALFFGVGLVGLGQEVLWTRFLSLWMPNTIHTYTLTLSSVLLGIVIGSLLAALAVDRLRRQAGWFGAAQVGSGLSVMLVMQAPPEWWGEWLSPVSMRQQLTVILVVMLLPAVLSGFSFPLAVRLAVSTVSQTGASVGRLAAYNMVGGIIGSLLVGFFLLPWLGMQLTLYFMTGISLALGIAAWWLLMRPTGAWWPRLTASVLGVAAWLTIPLILQTELPRDFLALEGELVDYREGVGATVAVVRQGPNLRLQINRMWQGQDRQNHQTMVAHIPSLLHPQPQSALVIGLGTGQTARSFLAHDLQHLHCVDVEDALIDLVARYYDSAWMEDPRVRLIVEDGRNYVAHTREQYDLISIEVGQIYRPHVAAFYSLDFYQRLRPRLRNGGLVCQFLPVEFFRPDEFRTLVKTFQTVFPQSVLWYNTSEFLLIGSLDTPATFRPSEWLARLEQQPRLKQELAYAYWGGSPYYLSRPEVFAAGYLCGPQQLETLSRGGELYRDDRPWLEYIPPLRAPATRDIVALVAAHLAPPAAAELETTELVDRVQRIRQQNLQAIVAQPMVQLAQALESAGQVDAAAQAYQQALLDMPDHPGANFYIAKILQQRGALNGAAACYQRALSSEPANAAAHANLAGILLTQQQPTQALEHYRTAVGLAPNDAELRVKLGGALSLTGQSEPALAEFERALHLQPDLAQAYLGIGNLFLSAGGWEPAVEAYSEAVARDPRLVEAHIGLGYAHQNAGRLTVALKQFRQALRLAPENPSSLRAAAWILATHPDPQVRQPQQAREWAERAWQLVAHREPQTADVLAAACAAMGDFESAVRFAETALQLANAAQMNDLSSRIEQRLGLYRAGQTFTQSATESP